MTARAARMVRRFRRSRSGATTVEFALIALPFITLLFAVFELGLTYMASTVLENALDAVSRDIRTGRSQAAGTSQAAFKSQVCAKLTYLPINCAADLVLDVRTFANFSTVAAPDPVTKGELDPTKAAYQPGTGGQIVLVRAFLQWRLITPSLNASLMTMSNGRRLISAAAAFQNEPF
jgi:Flp pilus assembly protein TadG